MKILIITPSYFPIRGGTEQVVHDLSEEFVKKGVGVTILTLNRSNSPQKREIVDGIPVYRIPFIGIPFFSYFFSNIITFFTVAILIKKNRFNIVAQYHVYPLGLGALLAAKITKTKFVTSLAGWDTYDPTIKLFPLFVKIMSWVMNNSDHLTSPSSHLAEVAQTLQGCKKDISVIPHGTRLRFSQKIFEGPIYKKYKTLNKKIILSVQRLHVRKGLKYLLLAIPVIVKSEPNVHFVICGTGPEEEKLGLLCSELMIEEYVTFEGFVKDEDLPQFHAVADLFALPTLYEGFGLVYIDALTYGTPIVTCNSGGPCDIINKNNGILVPTRDCNLFSEAVINGLRKKWDSEVIKQDALKYRWNIIADQYITVYKKLH